MSDLVTVKLSAKIDVENTIAEINKQTEEISNKVNPVKVKSTSSEVEGIKREYSEIAKVLDAVQTRTSKIYDDTGRLSKTVAISTDDYGRQLQVIKQLNEETGRLEVTQEKMTHNVQQISNQLNKFKDAQLFKIDKHSGSAGLSKEMEALRDSVKALSVETPNLDKLQRVLKDDISRVIYSENEAIKERNKELRELESLQNSLRKFQNTQLLRIDKHTGDSPTAEMQSLRSAVAELSAETSNLEQRKDALRDAISRVIETEKEELRTQREINKEVENAEKQQSKALWGMSKEALASRHTVSDELKHLNDWYAGLEKIDNKLNKFKADYAQKVRELTNSFGETEGIKSFSAEMEKLTIETPNASERMEELKRQFRDVKASAEEGAGGVKTITQSFGSAAKQALSFAGVHLSIYGVMNAIRDGIGTVNDMNASLTEIGMVTNQSVSDIGHLAMEYNNLAKEMKVSTGEVMDGVVSFTRQGLEQEEVMERLRATTMFSKITNLDFAQSVEFLTATVNSMNMDVERATDTFIYLGDSTATSGAEIAEGFNAVSGTANAMNLEFEKVSSWIAGISAKTREGASTIGRSLNMIISRMGRLTTEGFDEEDGTKINDVAEALNRIDVQLMDGQDNFRNFADVIDDVAGKWGTLDEKTKIYIGNAIAGARHQSKFFNLMEAYPETLELYEGALDSAGTTQEKFGIYTESTQAKLDTLKATVEELWLTLLDSGVIDAVVVNATRLVEAITKLVDKFGAFGIVVPLFLGLMAKGKLELSMFKDEADGAGVGLVKLTKKISSAIGSFTGLATASTAAKVAMGGLVGIFGIAIAASVRHANAYERNKQSMLEGADATRELISEMDKLEGLSKRQSELSAIDNASKEQKQELLDVQRELAQLYPTLATGLDEEGNAIANNTQAIQNLVGEKREMLMVQLEANKALADSTLPQMKSELEELTRAIEMQQDVLNNPDQHKENTNEVARALKENIEEYQKLVEEIKWAEDVIEKYNQETERQVELEKWRQAELIASKIETASSADELAHYEQQLLDLGFTSEQVSEILAGGLAKVKEAAFLASEAGYEYIMALDSMSEAEKESTSIVIIEQQNKTRQVIEETKKRIQAMQAELNAQNALYGMKREIANFTTLPGSIQDKYSDKVQKLWDTESKNARLEAELNAEMLKLRTEQAAAKRLDEMLSHVETLTPGGAGRQQSGTVSGAKKPSKKSGKKPKKKKEKKAKEYEAEQNAVKELERALNDLIFTTNRYEKLIADTKSSEKRNKKMSEIIDLYAKQQKMLNQINNEMRKERTNIGSSLSSQGVAKFDKATGALNVNLAKYNSLSDENKEKVDKQIKEFEKLTNSINTNSLKWFDLKKQIRDTNMELINLQTAEIKDALKYLDFDIEGLSLSIDKLTEDSKEYWDLQKEQLDLLAERRIILIELLEAREKDYHQTDLSLSQYEELEEQILDIKKAIRSVNEEMYSIGDRNKQYLAQVADDVVAMYKEVYNKQKDAALKALDEEMKVEEERHKQAMEHYDKEQKRVDELIKAKIDELDKRVDEEKYAQKLQKEQEERQKILNEINKYGMDDSLEGKQRVAKLTEELEKQDEKIANMKYDRDVQLRKKNLQDQLNKSKEEIKDNKEKEDEKYNQLKERYDKEKEDIIEHYDFILNNEREYAAIRENIMAGHFDQVYEDFTGFVDQFANDSIYLGDVITQSITDKLEEVTGVLQVLSDMRIDTDGNATVNVRKNTSQINRREKQSQKELINHIVWLKGKWEEADKKGDAEGKVWAKNKAQVYYADLDDDYAALLNQMNHAEAFEWYKSGQWEKVKPSPNLSKGDPNQKQQMYDKWLKDNVVEDNKPKGKDFSNFTGSISQVLNYKRDWDRYDKEYKQTGSSSAKSMRDRSSEEVKRIYRQMPPELARILQSMNYTQAVKWFNDGKYRNVYHTGGIVGGSGNKLTELLNQLSNQRNSAGANERIIKALNRELMIPEFNVSDKLAPNLREGMASTAGGGNVVNIGKLIDINEFNNQSDIDIKKLTKDAWDVTFKELGGRGFKFKR